MRIVITYSGARYLVLGARPQFGSDVDANLGTWNKNIPVLGYEHWLYSSTAKKLDGKVYRYENGTAEFDTGSAYCYVDDDFVDHYYAKIPGFTRKLFGTIEYYMIPWEIGTGPKVELDIGGQMFTLRHTYLPGAKIHVIDKKSYRIGAIQSKKKLLGDAGNLPDIVGRVALINMQLVLQMPDEAPHTISWRTKPTQFYGPAPIPWENV
ncbi:hypothetical protein B0H15DRAFT_807043 [Mycena belliarum]|uniref:Uncharacterized protein n=1 Tax=Mycena belliarum TaxID=1033014 RepID=A0AAD6XGK2_9AGAR|nr:hypothetical protein B0H15DRAFT_807043 [Mycena belliae]